MSDKQLRQAVIDELEFEPSIDAAHIGVAVEGGVITLSGHVGSYAQRYTAEKTARRVKGVRAIAEHIEVRYPDGLATSDDEIAQKALNLIDWDIDIPNDVKVKVENGNLTLIGAVDWQYQRRAAEAAMRKLAGVRNVINLVTIRQQVACADVKKRIEESLKRSAQVEANAIRVLVTDGSKVTLEGKVHTLRDRDSVERAAWSVPGVMKVEDHLRVA